MGFGVPCFATQAVTEQPPPPGPGCIPYMQSSSAAVFNKVPSVPGHELVTVSGELSGKAEPNLELRAAAGRADTPEDRRTAQSDAAPTMPPSYGRPGRPRRPYRGTAGNELPTLTVPSLWRPGGPGRLPDRPVRRVVVGLAMATDRTEPRPGRRGRARARPRRGPPYVAGLADGVPRPGRCSWPAALYKVTDPQ